MAKEMMIVFVYDTESCILEEDDPAEAVLYFHPGWVSDQQRLALCGQLMGTAHFLSSVFSTPKILCLQSGKFVLKHFGRYVLAVGTDRNMADWVVEHRATTLTSLIRFFNCDLETISQQLSNNVTNFKDKLYHMFETYLPILQYGGNMFSNVPSIQLPKSASNVFLEAIQTLQSCQENKGVLGGAMLYHNKVVATQLSSDLTKRIVITDPYRIKSPAETISTSFHLPVGVQLLQVYIESKEFNRLSKESDKTRTLFESVSLKKQKKCQPSKQSKEPVYSAMKRDQSLIFTTVPEEENDHSPIAAAATKAKSPVRPRSLSLKSTTTDLPRDFPMQTFNSNNGTFQRRISTPTVHTSVCSTPMTDKMLHGNVMSICCNPDDEIVDKDETNVQLLNFADLETVNVKNSINSNDSIKKDCDELSKDSFDKFKITTTNFFIANSLFDKSRSFSMRDLKSSFRSLSKQVTLRYYSIGLKNLNKDLTADLETSPNGRSPPGKQFYNTITDPYYPVFRCDGLPISKSLYDEYVAKQYDYLQTENDSDNLETEISFKTTTSDPNNKQSENSESKDSDIIDTEKVFTNEKENNTKQGSNQNQDSNQSTISQVKQRRSLSLPLKSLTTDPNTETDDSRPTSLFSPAPRRSLGGVQLTPLLSKLAVLALDEKSSGIGSRETTPSEFREFAFTPSDKSYSFPGIRKKSIKEESKKNALERDNSSDDEDVSSSEELEKAVLFVCGQQNMVLMMLVENDTSQDPDLILRLWEICFNSLNKLESQLHHCLDPCGGAAANDSGGEPYSYLCVDPKWDTVQRGGPWGVPELSVITHLHRNFTESRNLTEILVRNEDSIVYGYQCGQTEVFYQQSATSNSGLPTPADPMGTVPLKARRRLERDHAIILL